MGLRLNRICDYFITGFMVSPLQDPKWKQDLEKVKEKRPPFVFFDAHICVLASDWAPVHLCLDGRDWMDG